MSTSTAALASPDHILRSLLCVPPYNLRDDDGRNTLLGEWTAMVVAIDQPTQIWHGPVPLNLAADGPGAAATLTGELAANAHARGTQLIPSRAAAGEAPPSVGELRRHVVLADGQHAQVLALAGWPAALT